MEVLVYGAAGLFALIAGRYLLGLIRFRLEFDLVQKWEIYNSGFNFEVRIAQSKEKVIGEDICWLALLYFAEIVYRRRGQRSDVVEMIDAIVVALNNEDLNEIVEDLDEITPALVHLGRVDGGIAIKIRVYQGRFARVSWGLVPYRTFYFQIALTMVAIVKYCQNNLDSKDQRRLGRGIQVLAEGLLENGLSSHSKSTLMVMVNRAYEHCRLDK